MANIQKATFAGGCFWCTEAVFQRINGVKTVESGYSGGEEVNPTYEEVSRKQTSHAEAIQLEFDSEIISYEELLEIFFSTHDPTTLNQQGNDIGPQYRSVIFYHDENQKQTAENFIKELSESKKYSKPIVTKVEPFKTFYKAEEYHQNFYNENQNYPYCQIIIEPKVQKLMNKFVSKVKNNV